jgi:hypothetical protein
MLLTLARIVIKMILISATRLEAAAPRLMLPRLHHTYYIKQRKNLHKYVLLKAPRGEEREREREAKGDE